MIFIHKFLYLYVSKLRWRSIIIVSEHSSLNPGQREPCYSLLSITVMNTMTRSNDSKQTLHVSLLHAAANDLFLCIEPPLLGSSFNGCLESDEDSVLRTKILGSELEVDIVGGSRQLNRWLVLTEEG